PGPGDAFEVDDQDLGTEQIHVLASTRELPRVGEAFAYLKGEDAAPAIERAENAMTALVSTAKKECKEADGSACPRSRGLRLKPKGVTARLTSVPGDDAVFHTFSYNHVAAGAP